MTLRTFYHRILSFLTFVLVCATAQGQWIQEVTFDDSDMALDLTSSATSSS